MSDAAPAPAEPPAELHRTGAACPRCGAAPALRVAASLCHVVRQLLPSSEVATYQCQRRGCGHVYAITAAELAEHGSTKRRRRVITRGIEPEG